MNPDESLYFLFYDPLVGRLPIPANGILGCDPVCVKISRSWVPALVVALDRLSYTDAWQGTKQEALDACQQIERLIGQLLDENDPESECGELSEECD